jgi:hypothetical protein
MGHGTSVTLDLPLADAAGRVRAARPEQGLGVLAEINLTAVPPSQARHADQGPSHPSGPEDLDGPRLKIGQIDAENRPQ